MTAVEWGLLANLSLRNRTLPHGNTYEGNIMQYYTNTEVCTANTIRSQAAAPLHGHTTIRRRACTTYVETTGK